MRSSMFVPRTRTRQYGINVSEKFGGRLLGSDHRRGKTSRRRLESAGKRSVRSALTGKSGVGSACGVKF